MSPGLHCVLRSRLGMGPRPHHAGTAFLAAVTCEIGIPRESTNGCSQTRAEKPIASIGETDNILCDAPQPRTSRRPGEASSQTGASRTNRRTYGRTDRQTDGPEERQGWLAQRTRLKRADSPSSADDRHPNANADRLIGRPGCGPVDGRAVRAPAHFKRVTSSRHSGWRRFQ